MKTPLIGLALLLAVPGPLDSGLMWDRFGDARVAYTLRIPPGWRATVYHGATIITSAPVVNRYDNPERVRLPYGGAYVWLFDYGRIPGGAFADRPEHLELGKKEQHTCGFGEGYMLHFRDRGRLLQAFVKLGRGADERTVVAVLNSVRVTK